jgi:hypothetical protein
MKKRHKKQGRDKDQAGVLARPSWCFGKTKLVFWQDQAGVLARPSWCFGKTELVLNKPRTKTKSLHQPKKSIPKSCLSQNVTAR